MALQEGRRFHGLALVPDDRSAQWFQLARHMRVVSHIPAGSRVLEQYGTGAWRPVPARRDLILLAYPRTVGTAAAVVGPSAGAQFQAHVGQMVEARMFAQFPELEPAERKRRRQEQEQAAAAAAAAAAAGASAAAVGDPVARPPGWRCGCVGGAPQRRCSLCDAAWWCTRCYASECACATEVERRAASADEMSGVIDLCSPTASTPVGSRRGGRAARVGDLAGCLGGGGRFLGRVPYLGLHADARRGR